MNISINGYEWEIKFVNPLNDNLKRHDGSITLGVTNLNDKCVYISNKLHGGLLYKVVCHELCHVFIFSYNYYISIDEEERLAEFISMFGRQIIGITDEIVDELFKFKVG